MLVERSEEKSERNSSEHRGWRGRSCSRPGADIFWGNHSGAGISLTSTKKTVVEQISMRYLMEDHAGTDIHGVACGGPHARAGGRFLKELQNMESLCWSTRNV